MKITRQLQLKWVDRCASGPRIFPRLNLDILCIRNWTTRCCLQRTADGGPLYKKTRVSFHLTFLRHPA